MILAHIYIAEHKSLRDLNIKTSGSFDCHFDKHDIRLVCLDSTAKYYKDHSCSAIIGPNGVGKSTILEFIELLEIETDSRGVIVFYDTKKESFVLLPINYLELSKSVIHANRKYTPINKRLNFLKGNKINLIKLNNLPSHLGDGNLARAIISKKIHDLTPSNTYNTYSQRKKYFKKLLEYFADGHILEPYMENVYFEFVFNPSPTSIIDNVINEDLSDKYQHRLTEWKEKRRELALVMPERGDSYGTFIQNILALNAPSIIKTLSNLDEHNDLSSYFLYRYAGLELYKRDTLSTKDMLVVTFAEDDKFAVGEQIREIIKREPDKNRWPSEVNLDAISTQLENIFNSIEDIAETIYDYYQDLSDITSNSIRIDHYSTVTKLIDKINQLPSPLVQNIRWGWRGISSGEMARTHILSESYHYLKSTASQGTNIFLMDEIDLYLHPEWQRKFLSEFLLHLSILEMMYEHPPSQIILCTHSPIIISDFLPDDIVSLRKIDDGSYYGFNEVEVTESVGFGNTITDIYMQGMHLESTFGELTRIKIEDLMAKIKKGDLSSKDKELILKIKNDNIKKFFLYHDKNKQITQR